MNVVLKYSQQYWDDPLLFFSNSLWCFFNLHVCINVWIHVLGTNGFTWPPNHGTIRVKCLAQGHKKRHTNFGTSVARTHARESFMYSESDALSIAQTIPYFFRRWRWNTLSFRSLLIVKENHVNLSLVAQSFSKVVKHTETELPEQGLSVLEQKGRHAIRDATRSVQKSWKILWGSACTTEPSGLGSRGPPQCPWWGPGATPRWGSRGQRPRKLLDFRVFSALGGLFFRPFFSIPLFNYINEIMWISGNTLEAGAFYWSYLPRKPLVISIFHNKHVFSHWKNDIFSKWHS